MTSNALSDKLLEHISGVPYSEITDVRIIASGIMRIYDSYNYGFKYTLEELMYWFSQFPHIPILGQAFWKVSLQCTNEIMKLLLHLCAVICMHNIARIKLCITLESFESFDPKIKKALLDISLLDLVEAINNFQKDCQMTKKQELIIAFLREYPDTYVARNPNSFQSLKFILSDKLHTILQRRLSCQ